MNFNLYALLSRLGVFGSFIIDDNGSGSGDDGSNNNDGSDDNNNDGSNNNSSRDANIDDNDLDDDTKNKNNSDDLESMKKKLDALQKDKDKRDETAAHDTAVLEVKNTYPDFDQQKVKDKLIELNKDTPGLGDRYNSPMGWEAIWLKFFQTAPVDNDDFDPGRNEHEKFDFEESMKKLESGDEGAINSLLEHSISTNH